MSSRFARLATVLSLSLMLAAAVTAVPLSINYQGRLTDNLNQPVADDTYTITFHIYAGAAGGSPLWSETRSVPTTDGLFEVLLGQSTPIATDLFDGSTRYLAIAVFGQSESTERIPMVSVPYAMVAGSVAGNTTDCHDCDTVFLNAVGPEELRASADTALKVTDTGFAARVALVARLETETADTVAAVQGVAFNIGSGRVMGATFEATSGGSAPAQGLRALAETNSNTYSANGIIGEGRNHGAGAARGGYFSAIDDGSGTHWGIAADAISNNAATAYGISCNSTNTGSGTVYGGRFVASNAGSGAHYGLHATSSASGDSAAIGSCGLAVNTGLGKAIGGSFSSYGTGSGDHYGIYAESDANTPALSSAIRGIARNYSSGPAYGGYFTTEELGTGSTIGLCASALGHNSSTYGLYGSAISDGSGLSRGIYTYAAGMGSNSVFGGQFTAANSGTGETYGVSAWASANSSATVYGVDVEAYGAAGFSGALYGANCVIEGGASAGTQYGIYSLSTAASPASSYGIYARSEHSGAGTSYGAYFLVDSNGTGQSRGVRAVGLSKGSAAAYGVMGVSANRSTGDSYGGYFEALNYSGTGTHYGIYAKAPTAGYAGYFSGHIRVTGNQTVLGTKSAAVEVDEEDFRLVYSQESPECWFEDFGEGQLVNGRTHIELDPLFLRTVTIDERHPMKVFIQLNDPDCHGTAVIRGTTGFDVVELMTGTGGATFTYRVVAKRRGYEDNRLVQMAGPTPREVAAQVELDREALAADEGQMERDYLKQQETHRQKLAEDKEELARPVERHE